MQQLQVTTAVIMKHTRLSKYNCNTEKNYIHTEQLFFNAQ